MGARSPEKQTEAKQVITGVMDATEDEPREPWEGTRGGHQCLLFIQGFIDTMPQGRVLQPPASEPPGKLGSALSAYRQTGCAPS